MPARVLVVMDQPVLAQVVLLALSHAPYSARVVRDGAQAATVVEHWHPHLAVVDMDIGLNTNTRGPGSSPASAEPLPVIALTRRGDLQTTLEAIDSGVADILSVPFLPEELVARALAVTQRTYGETVQINPVIQVGEIQLDILHRRVHSGGSTVQLRSLEQTLLYLLAANAGRLLGRKEILDHIWGAGCAPDSNMVDRDIHALRAKLHVNGLRPRYIQTVPSKGYRFQRASSRAAALMTGRLEAPPAGRPAPRTAAMRLVELQYGKPLEALLDELLGRLTMQELADELGIGLAELDSWLAHCGLSAPTMERTGMYGVMGALLGSTRANDEAVGGSVPPSAALAAPTTTMLGTLSGHVMALVADDGEADRLRADLLDANRLVGARLVSGQWRKSASEADVNFRELFGQAGPSGIVSAWRHELAAGTREGRRVMAVADPDPTCYGPLEAVLTIERQLHQTRLDDSCAVCVYRVSDGLPDADLDQLVRDHDSLLVNAGGTWQVFPRGELPHRITASVARR